MDSDIIDKLLIILLIILLPISVFIASNYQKKNELALEKEIEQEQMKKVTAAVNQINSQQIQPQYPVEIEQVYFATESSKLVITGKAPKANSTLMVSSVISIKNSQDKNSSSSAKKEPSDVLGQAVDVVAIKSEDDGSFTFVKKIDSKPIGIIDLRFDMDQSSATVQYDLEENKQL